MTKEGIIGFSKENIQHVITSYVLMLSILAMFWNDQDLQILIMAFLIPLHLLALYPGAHDLVQKMLTFPFVFCTFVIWWYLGYYFEIGDKSAKVVFVLMLALFWVYMYYWDRKEAQNEKTR